MNDKQWQAMHEYFSGWLDKASVGFVLIGMFQPEHMFGGLIGAAVCGLVGPVLKIWSKK